MAGFPGLEELFEGRHFDRVNCLVCEVVPARQVQLPRLGGDDGRTRPVDRSHHHHAVDPSLCSRVRAPLEPICAAGRAFVARRRDLRENS